MAEQSVVFNQNPENQEEFESFLVFGFTDDNGDIFEEEVPFSCGESMESYMKSFFNKKWNDILPAGKKHLIIEECVFEGIHMRGKQEKGRFATYLTNNYKRNVFIVNEKAMINESAEKLLQLRTIILS